MTTGIMETLNLDIFERRIIMGIRGFKWTKEKTKLIRVKNDDIVLSHSDMLDLMNYLGDRTNNHGNSEAEKLWFVTMKAYNDAFKD